MGDRMTASEFLGAGVCFASLCAQVPRLAADFRRAIADITERMELQGEGGMSEPPFVNWTFHRVGTSRWIARMVMYRRSETLYVEWNRGMGRWDDRRAQSTLLFLVQEPTRPLRVRPRGTTPEDPT